MNHRKLFDNAYIEDYAELHDEDFDRAATLLALGVEYNTVLDTIQDWAHRNADD